MATNTEGSKNSEGAGLHLLHGFPHLTQKQIDKFQRIPFVDGGRSYKGADCWGLIWLIYKSWGIELPTYGEIGATELLRVRNQISSDRSLCNWAPVEITQEKLGDIVVMTGAMRTSDGHLRHALVHVGLIVRPGWLIHTEAEYGVMVVAFRGGHRRQEISSRVKEIYRYVDVSHTAN